MTFPYSTGQIPIYYNHRQSGRTHQGKYQDIPSTPLYDFAHGLSYTTFEYGDLQPSATTLRRGEKLTVTVSVTNTGEMDGAETVHWFIADPRMPYFTASQRVETLRKTAPPERAKRTRSALRSTPNGT